MIADDRSFHYQAGHLTIENCPVETLADSIKTPFYVYSQARLEQYAADFKTAFVERGVRVCFAVKASSNQAIIRLFGKHGFGADVVSGGELQRALKAEIPPDRIVFSGVGKTAEELTLALTSGISQINVESIPEFDAIAALAQTHNLKAPLVLRINPDVDAETHSKISTGRAHDKFGISFEEAMGLFERAKSLPHIALHGLAFHIGSQILDTGPYEKAYARMAEFVTTLRAKGHTIDRLDAGGGFGVSYGPQSSPCPLSAFAAVLERHLKPLDCQLTIEPGRALVANAGILISRIIYIKEKEQRRFMIVDAAMNDLIRPALYEAWHEIVPVQEPQTGQSELYDVVGPVCETGDTFAMERRLPVAKAGDLVAFLSAGAYGAAMSSTYNTRPLIPEVMVNVGQFATIRRRLEVEDILDLEEDLPKCFT